MFKNGNDVAYDCDAEVHHDVFTEIHQHVFGDPAGTWKIRKYCLHFPRSASKKNKLHLQLNYSVDNFYQECDNFHEKT